MNIVYICYSKKIFIGITRNYWNLGITCNSYTSYLIHVISEINCESSMEFHKQEVDVWDRWKGIQQYGTL